MTDPPTADRFRRDLLQWFEENGRSFLWRDPEASVYEVFIAEFFLTQTPAENVADVYPEFLDQYPSLTAVDEATKSELATVIEPLGFQNMRAAALADIASRHETIPTDRDELVDLPRVGAYVADATLCFALNESRVLLDRNVKRIYGRVFQRSWPSSEGAQRAFARDILPDEGPLARRYNLALLDFGAVLCTRQTPRCSDCWVSGYCNAYQAESV